tara:strand:- start:22679 stop:23146 length:468 start_codon:yes stop_codon:yes gene_type:complete
MKRIALILFLTVVMSVNGFAQKLIWHTDMEKAIDVAIIENKKMLLFFTGSDWCGWCMKLQNEVLKTSGFEKWANENVVLVELDFPRRTPQDETIKVQNRQLQSLFQVRGYPSVYFVNPEKLTDGKMNLNNLGKTGYIKGGASKWLEVANNIIKAN